MKPLKLQVGLLSLSRKEGCLNVGFRLFSSAVGAETISDILEREYCEVPSDAPRIGGVRARKAVAIPDSRKAFIEETIVAINSIMQELTGELPVSEYMGAHINPPAQTPETENPSMRSCYGVYRLLLEICSIRSWIDRDSEFKKFQLVLRPTQVAWVLRVQKESSQAWDFFNWAARKTGYAHDQHCYAIMIDLLGRSSDFLYLDSLLLDMDRLQVPHNVVTLNRLIDIYAVKGDPEKAELFFTKLKALEVQPNAYIAKCMMEVFATASKCEKALELFEVMRERRQFLGTKSYNKLLESLSRNDMHPSTVVSKVQANYNWLRWKQWCVFTVQ